MPRGCGRLTTSVDCAAADVTSPSPLIGYIPPPARAGNPPKPNISSSAARSIFQVPVPYCARVYSTGNAISARARAARDALMGEGGDVFEGERGEEAEDAGGTGGRRRRQCFGGGVARRAHARQRTNSVVLGGAQRRRRA